MQTRHGLDRADVIAPNFKKRMSGVTSTVFRLVPLQAATLPIVCAGLDVPEDVPQVRPLQLITMSRNGPSGHRVWHARRNNEMIAGLILKHVLRKRLKLVFTSAAQRDHKRLTRWLIARMDRVIATSSKSAAYLKVPSTVIHHGIDTRRFCPPADKAALRRDLGLAPDATLVGCFGRIRPQKGNDLFVDVMLRLLGQRPDVVAVMMGGVTSKHRAFAMSLTQRVEESGHSSRFLILPEQTHWDISRWFRALDLYVAPQRWEGFGLTPLEAMGCGVPVVATRVGAFEDLIVEGETGHLVDPGDVDAMERTLARLLDDADMRRRYAANASAHVKARFRLGNEAEAINAIYRDLLDREN